MFISWPVPNSFTGAQLNASLTRGDVVAWAMQVQVNGAPLNLTGANIRLTIGFPDPVEFSVLNNGITITNATQGDFTINMSTTRTAAFAPGEYPYDMWIEPQVSPPIESQYFTGIFTVNQSVTAVP